MDHFRAILSVNYGTWMESKDPRLKSQDTNKCHKIDYLLLLALHLCYYYFLEIPYSSICSKNMTSTSTNEEIVNFALESLLLASTNRRSSHASFSSSCVDRMSILKIPSDITNKLNQMYDKEITSGDEEENVSDNQSEANDETQTDIDTDEKKKKNTANCCVPYSGIKECQAWMMVSIGAGGFIPAMVSLFSMKIHMMWWFILSKTSFSKLPCCIPASSRNKPKGSIHRIGITRAVHKGL